MTCVTCVTGSRGGLSPFLQGIAATQDINWRTVAMGASEAFVVLFMAFGNLTIAWLLVALGIRRAS